METLTSIRRAGADGVITYHAKDAAAMAQPRSRRSAAARTARPCPLDDCRQAGCSTCFRAASRWRLGPFAHVAELAGLSEEEVLRRSAAPARRAHHPRDHAHLRHPRAGLQVDAGGRTGGRREPVAGGQDHQLASRRLAQLPARPRLQPLVHDRHRAGLAARAARARSRCSSGLTGAESVRQLPTLRLFKIRMDLEMEKGTETLAQRRPRQWTTRSPRRSSCRSSTWRSSAPRRAPWR